MNKLTVVNLFAGPGAGKSALAAGVFHHLKVAGHNVELVTEFAKDLTWEESREVLNCQPYVYGEQFRRLWRLRGKVGLAITDSPLALSSFYAPPEYPQALIDGFLAGARMFRNINVVVNRGRRPFNPAGRNQTEAEALEIDARIHQALDRIPGAIFRRPYHADEAAVLAFDIHRFLPGLT